MTPCEIFLHCPRCGAPRAAAVNPFRCGACQFVYYFNPCSAVAGFVLNDHCEALFLRRAKEPARGKLAVPGGFIDIGETAEAALRRETLEEVDLELGDLTYLSSRVNSYHYQDVTYPVLDFFYLARALNAAAARPLDGVDSFCWMQPERVDPGEIAFPSIRAALEQLVQMRSEG